MSINLNAIIDRVEDRTTRNRLGKLTPREMDKDIMVLRDALEVLVELRSIIRAAPHQAACPSRHYHNEPNRCNCWKAQFEEMI